eukprot:TRINITY_DN91594_c0_g1_i1.p1 TRINITY_DN91594_c0_g1~~TRINITY_DN91594_c0_g1_i1.p1  ORF type:complete len:492 (+),score=112.58 TRINITY_DN91594_c0_g1_i1:79-1554(+)
MHGSDADSTPVHEAGRTAGLVPTQELWRFFKELLQSCEEERPVIFEKIEALRVSAEDVHREDWERRTRLQEIEDLKAQVREAEFRLSSQQEGLLRQAQENDNLRAQAPCWEADLEHVRALTQPRVENIRYSPGELPERAGGVARAKAGGAAATSAPGAKREAASAASFGGAAAASVSGSRVKLEYKPFDHEAAVQLHLKSLEDRLERERNGHASAKKALAELMRVEDEESEMLLCVLRDNLERVKRERDRLRQEADSVSLWNLRLQSEHASVKETYPLEVAQLTACNQSLSMHLQQLTERRDHAQAQAEATTRRLEASAAQSNMCGVTRAREDAATARHRLGAAEVRGTRYIRSLQEQVDALRTRYERLEQHRSDEVSQLRRDVAALHRATRECEKLAARCVAGEFAKQLSVTPGGGGGEISVMQQRRGPAARQPATHFEAMALRPAVMKLRAAIEQCERSLREERTLTDAAVGTVVAAVGESATDVPAWA